MDGNSEATKGIAGWPVGGIGIKNYRVLKDVTLGKLWNTPKVAPLTPLTAVVGKNGVGKSSLFDAFGFLTDCLKWGVEEACDTRGRGGFDRIRFQGTDDPIEFVVYYREHARTRPITYELAINRDESGRPYVSRERLRQRRSGQRHGKPFSFLMMKEGKGIAWKGEATGEPLAEDPAIRNLFLETLFNQFLKNSGESADTEIVELQDKRRLGIATLGVLKQHPRIASLRQFIEGWYLSYFSPDAAPSVPWAGPQRHWNIHGDNIANVVQFMERAHPESFDQVLRRVAGKVPGTENIDTERSSDGRWLLRFNDRGFRDPFYAQQMSDGTLKVFAYLLLLEDPEPPPFLCIEEPENGLYHRLLEVLADEFRERATGRDNAHQIFVTTHQPYFMNALRPEETWILEKDSNGFAIICRCNRIDYISALVEEGLPLGNLWYSDYFDQRMADAL